MQSNHLLVFLLFTKTERNRKRERDMKSTLNREEKEACSFSCWWSCSSKVSLMEFSNSCSSFSSSSVDSTKPSPSESSVNLSLSLTFPSTSPQRSSSHHFSVFLMFCFCSVLFCSHLCFESFFFVEKQDKIGHR